MLSSIRLIVNINLKQKKWKIKKNVVQQKTQHVIVLVNQIVHVIVHVNVIVQITIHAANKSKGDYN